MTPRGSIGGLKWLRVGLAMLWISGGLRLDAAPAGEEGSDPSYGLLLHRFDLTLQPGKRLEAVGPLYFQERLAEGAHGWGFPPLVSWTRDPGTESSELDILYPLLTYDRFGPENRWQFLQLLGFSGGTSMDNADKRRFSLFPFYFQQRSSDPANRYTAVVPFYGTFKNRFFRDEVNFLLLPLYVKSLKREVYTENYVYPFFHVRYGGGVTGWQFWPVIGAETKAITQKTNNWGDTIELPGHRKVFFAWPIYFNEHLGLGTTNEQHSFGFVPLFTVEHSPLRDSLAFPWPLGYRVTHDREKQYREWSAPWPLITFARGPGKTANRVWPLFSRAATPEIQTSFYLWPIYKTADIHAAPYERDLTKVLFYLYSGLHERNTDTGEHLTRHLLWPLFSYRSDFQGRQRFQALALLEPLLPTSKSIERNYSPVYALWRDERNPVTKTSSQSLLWNLYRHETTKDSKKCSILFGLFQYQTGAVGKHMRLFYIPFGKKPAAQTASPKTEPVSQPAVDAAKKP